MLNLYFKFNEFNLYHHKFTYSQREIFSGKVKIYDATTDQQKQCLKVVKK